jgi:hypothetical protein
LYSNKEFPRNGWIYFCILVDLILFIFDISGIWTQVHTLARKKEASHPFGFIYFSGKDSVFWLVFCSWIWTLLPLPSVSLRLWLCAVTLRLFLQIRVLLTFMLGYFYTTVFHSLASE